MEWARSVHAGKMTHESRPGKSKSERCWRLSSSFVFCWLLSATIRAERASPPCRRPQKGIGSAPRALATVGSASQRGACPLLRPSAPPAVVGRAQPPQPRVAQHHGLGQALPPRRSGVPAGVGQRAAPAISSRHAAASSNVTLCSRTPIIGGCPTFPIIGGCPTFPPGVLPHHVLVAVQFHEQQPAGPHVRAKCVRLRHFPICRARASLVLWLARQIWSHKRLQSVAAQARQNGIQYPPRLGRRKLSTALARKFGRRAACHTLPIRREHCHAVRFFRHRYSIWRFYEQFCSVRLAPASSLTVWITGNDHHYHVELKVRIKPGPVGVTPRGNVLPTPPPLLMERPYREQGPWSVRLRQVPPQPSQAPERRSADGGYAYGYYYNPNDGARTSQSVHFGWSYSGTLPSWLIRWPYGSYSYLATSAPAGSFASCATAKGTGTRHPAASQSPLPS